MNINWHYYQAPYKDTLKKYQINCIIYSLYWRLLEEIEIIFFIMN